MTSIVYYGSPRQAKLEGKETLPAKLDLILEKLKLRDRVKDELVAIKMHVGNNIIYSTIHPVFVRKVVQAIKDGGGTPFVADVSWDVAGAETRAYTQETLGCPVYPAGGLKDRYYYRHEYVVQEHENLGCGGHDRGCHIHGQFCPYKRASILWIWRRIQEYCLGLHGR